MSPDVKLFVLFAVLHLIGLGLAAMFLVMFVRSDTVKAWSPPEDDGGGGGSDRLEPRPSVGPDGGGIQLPDALPARVRLREPARIAELLPKAERRPAHPRPMPGPRVPA